jgi:hypothetical protein
VDDDADGFEPVAYAVVAPEDVEQVDVALHRRVDGLEVEPARRGGLVGRSSGMRPSALSSSSEGVDVVGANEHRRVVGFDDRRLAVCVHLSAPLKL